MSESKFVNWVDPSMSSLLREKANTILKEFDLKGIRVRYNSETKHLSFTQDRRVVDVPVVLIDGNHWSDIRYLFRAVLGSAPGAWNLSADENDWSAYKR